MTVHQASEHPWIKEEHTELDKRIPASRYAGVRDKMHEKYVSLTVLDFVEFVNLSCWTITILRLVQVGCYSNFRCYAFLCYLSLYETRTYRAYI